MDVEFDGEKDRSNITKHGISLARAGELETLLFVDDGTRFNEPRYRLYGLIDGAPYIVSPQPTATGGLARSVCAEPMQRSYAAMESQQLPVVFDDDNPEWTVEDFARARPASELPAHILAAFPHSRLGHGQAAVTPPSERSRVTLRLPKSVIAHFKAGGPGWQTRAIAVLEREVERARS